MRVNRRLNNDARLIAMRRALAGEMVSATDNNSINRTLDLDAFHHLSLRFELDACSRAGYLKR